MRKNKNQPEPRRVPRSAEPNQRVFSYYSNRSDGGPASPAISSGAKRKVNWTLLPTFIAAAAIAVSLFYASLLETNPRISTGDNPAAILQSEAIYQQAAQDLLSDSILSRSKFLIDTRSVEAKMLVRFPELKTVSITIPLTSRRPIMALEPVTPVLIMYSNSTNYVIDGHGRAVLELNSRQAFEGLPLVTDESGLQVKLGRQILSMTEVSFLRELHHQLTSAGIAPETMTLPAVPNQVDMRIAGEAYYVKFNLQGDARLQFGTYQSVQKRLAEQRTPPAEYIDVRVEEKAFIR